MWIKFTDRVPDHGVTNLVLIHDIDGYIQIGFYCEYDKLFFDYRYTHYIANVTHWMPLPSPPTDLN